MANKRHVLAAFALLAVATMTIAYSQLLLEKVTVTTEEVVFINPVDVKFPTRSTGQVRVNEVITLDFTRGGFKSGDEVTVHVEFVIDDPKIYEGFRSLVLQVMDGATCVATLTLDVPYDEFTVTVPGPLPAAKVYDLVIVYHTTKKPISASFKLSASITVLG